MIRSADIIVKMIFGSHLYGTATSESDLDYKGIFLPSKEEILLGNIPKGYSYSTRATDAKNTADDTDVELYSLHYFIKLACEGQTVALDMLHAPDAMIMESSDIWTSIVEPKAQVLFEESEIVHPICQASGKQVWHQRVPVECGIGSLDVTQIRRPNE